VPSSATGISVHGLEHCCSQIAAQAWNLLSSEVTMPSGASKVKMLWALALLKMHETKENLG
jgi:hypothetical protein